MDISTENTIQANKKILKRIRNIEKRIARIECADILKRFKHHLMYDVVKQYNVQLPTRLNPKKRTNFVQLAEIILTDKKVPQNWKTGITTYIELSRKKLFPLNFWEIDNTSQITDEQISNFLEFADTKYSAGLEAMIRCSLECSPPTAPVMKNSQSSAELKQHITDQVIAGLETVSKSRKLKLKKMAAKNLKKSNDNDDAMGTVNEAKIPENSE